MGCNNSTKIYYWPQIDGEPDCHNLALNHISINLVRICGQSTRKNIRRQIQPKLCTPKPLPYIPYPQFFAHFWSWPSNQMVSTQLIGFFLGRWKSSCPRWKPPQIVEMAPRVVEDLPGSWTKIWETPTRETPTRETPRITPHWFCTCSMLIMFDVW